MKKLVLIFLGVSFLTCLSSCKRKKEPNKILDGFANDTTQTVIPAQAIQQFLLLKKDTLKVIVPVLNKLTAVNSHYDELSSTTPSVYNFQLSNSHYGTATVGFRFWNESNVIIDPIQTQISSSSVRAIQLWLAGGSALFPSYDESFWLSLGTTGDPTSTKYLMGDSHFSGSNHTLTFSIAAPGSRAAFEGLIDSGFTASGTGIGGQTVTANMFYSADHNTNGTLNWEGRSGNIHMDDRGNGFIITDQTRLFIN